MAAIFTQGYWVMGKLGYVKLFCCKVETQMFRVVDYVREMTSKNC